MSEPQTATPPPDRWAIVEVMGHRVVAGRLSFGEPPYDRGIAVDVPLRAQEGQPETFAQEFYGHGAIFALRIVPEDVARRAAEGSYHVRELGRVLNPLALPPMSECSKQVGDICKQIDEQIREPEYDEVGLLNADHWELGLREHLTAIEEHQPAHGPVVYRKLLLRLATTAVAAIIEHDAHAGVDLDNPDRDEEDDDEEDDDEEDSLDDEEPIF